MNMYGECHAADVVYEMPDSRVAENFVRTAYYGCIRPGGLDTHLVGTIPLHSNASARTVPKANASFGAEKGYPCACSRHPIGFWWDSDTSMNSSALAAGGARGRAHDGGRATRGAKRDVATEVCGCNLCRTLCPGPEE